MFNKKIEPDFSPRLPTPVITRVAAPIPQPVRFPPYTPPPPAPVVSKLIFQAPIPAQEVQPVQTFSVVEKVSKGVTLPVPAGAAASFSPSIETFTGTGDSYFKLASAPSEAQTWWQYPAGGEVDMSGNNLIMNNGAIYSASDVTTTSLLVTQQASISSLGTGEINTNYISSVTGSISSLTTRIISLDGATLTTAGGPELLLNGIPIATTSNISSLSDWAYFPAISTLNMNGNPILGASDLQVSTINGGSISSISASNWASYPALSTINANNQGLINVSTINGAVFPAPASGVTSLNAQTGTVALTSAGSTVTITNPTPGTINLESAAGSGAPYWANYAAVSNVIIPNFNLEMCNSLGGLGSFCNANINATLNVGNVTNAPFRPDFNAYVGNFTVGSIVSPTLGVTFNSLGGVNINSLVGVSIAGGGGVAITGVGGINLQGGGAINVASGGILVSGGGIAITAGGMAVNGGGLLVAAGGMSVTGGNVEFPFASTTMGTSSAPGGEFALYGNNMKLLPSGATQSALLTENIGSTSFSNTMRISGVSTINGVAFPPPTPGVNPDVLVSTLTAATYISTPITYTNQITGAGVIVGSTPGLGITIGTGATEVNMTADTYIDSPLQLHANLITDVVQASISSIVNVSSINGAVYPPTTGGVASLNTLSGALTLAAGTNIDITPSGSTLTIQAKNYPISERATSITPVTITAVTFGTAQTLLTFTITPTFVSDIDVTCSFTYQTNSNTIYDLIFFITLDGAQIGLVMRNSLGGVNHFNCVPILASALSQSAGLHTIAVKAYAGSAPAAGNLTVTAISAISIANLV